MARYLEWEETLGEKYAKPGEREALDRTGFR
jgi:hypothetical protein